MSSLLRVSANLRLMFAEAGNLINRYYAAHKAGFKLIECAFPYSYKPEKIQCVLASTGLKQVFINTCPGNLEAGEIGFASLSGKESEFKTSLEKSLQYAEALGCSMLHIMAGRRQEAVPFENQLATLEDNLRFAVASLEQENIVGLIEPISPLSNPGYFLNDFSTALSLIEKINSPFLKLQLDIFHLQAISGNLSSNLKNYIPLAGHVQVAQAPGRNEPSSFGELNYKYIFSFLEKNGYTGIIGAEYVPSGKSEESLQWIQDYSLSF